MSAHGAADSAFLEEVFPFYLSVDQGGVIVGLGRSLQKLLGPSVVGSLVSQWLSILRPHGVTDFTLLNKRSSKLVVLQLRNSVRLRGQVVAQPDRFTFVGSPWFEDIDDLVSHGLTVNDFAPYDGATDYAVLLSQVRAQLKESNELAHRLSSEIQQAERLRDEAREATHRAVESTQTRERFLAMMSHELRTPLTTILATNQLMLMNDLAPQQREHALAQQRAGHSLLALINSVLDLSKLQAGKFDLIPEPFELRLVTEDVVGSLREEAERRGLVVEWIVSKEIPLALKGDPVRLNQVLTNLVANALKFTERGGVLVRVKLTELEENRCKVLFSVSDSGIGIAPDALEGLFRPFVQVHRDVPMPRDRASGYVGTGLGLSICKQIAELMGGTAAAKSAPGRGSTFWFNGWFEIDHSVRGRRTGQFKPLTIPPVALSTGSVAASKPQTTNLRAPILIVEDDAVNRQLLSLMVRSMGYHTEAVSDGASALSAVKERTYAVVLMDCSMPGMDGFAATKAIRAMSSEVADTPIIAVTAHALEGDRERCLNEGMDDYLAKPFNPVQIRETLARWIPSTPTVIGATAGSLSRLSATNATGFARSSVDPSVLQKLREYQQPDEPDLVEEVVTLYRADAHTHADAAIVAVERRDADLLRLHTHALKGASSNVGAKKIERLARWLEVVDRRDDWALTEEVVRALKTEIDPTVTLLRAV